MNSKWKGPVVVLTILALILVVVYSGPKGPQLMESVRLLFEKSEESSQVESKESAPEITDSSSVPQEESKPSQIPEDIETSKTVKVRFTLSSAQEDLYISVLDEKGRYISERFTFSVKDPSGKTTSYTTSLSGVWYITNIASGKYEVAIEDLSVVVDRTEYKYVFAKHKQTIQVNEKVVPHIISIEELRASVATYSDESELTGNQDDKGEAEDIVIEPFDGDVFAGYVYTYETSPNGYLWAAGTNKTVESNIKPVLDEDGFLIYGIMDDGTRVELFYPDGEPFPEYDLNFGPPEGARLGEYIENGKRYYFKADGTTVEGPGLKKINNKLYFITKDNVVSSSCGIDISAYQTVTDWAKVKSSGIDFVIIRIAGRGWETGLLFEDSKGMDWVPKAKAAGLKVGVYIFSTAVNTQEAVEEASLCVDLLKGIELDYPIFFDTEFGNTSHTGRADALSKSQRTLIAKTFCETVEASGYKAGVYASASFFVNQLDMSQLKQYMFWMAHYTKNYALSNYNVKYKIWQFTSSGSVSGISGRVDMNTIFD